MKQDSYISGKCQGNLDFFKVRELSGNYVMGQGRMKFCKNIKEMSGNFTFQPDEAGMFGIFLAKLIKFSATILSGKFEFVSGKCQGILVSPKCMNSELRTTAYIFSR